MVGVTLNYDGENCCEALPKKIEWAYDANGNITQRKETDDSDVVTTYGFTYNNLDWMTQRTLNGGSPITFTYDNNGNLTSDSAGRSFTWNGLDRLTSMTASSVTTNFTYDPLGRRTGLTQGMTSKTYFYDGLDMLSDGTHTYLNGASIDEPLETTESSTISTYLSDHLGSITQMTDDTGTSLGQYSYKPYGKLLTSSTPVSGNPFTYTAREDDGTGLYYYRARYYDPTLELFISQDPLGDAQRYVAGNPISFVDPLGLLDVSFGNGYNAVPSLWNGTNRWEQASWAGSYAPDNSVIASSHKGLRAAFTHINPNENVNIFAHGNAMGISATFAHNSEVVSIGIGLIPYVFEPLKVNPPKAIVLYACETSSESVGSYNFAQALSNYVGNTPVYASPYLQNGKWGYFNKYVGGKKVGSEFMF